MAQKARQLRAEKNAREVYARYGTAALRCECCGYTPLQKAKIVDGRLLGPECSRAGHRFPCRDEQHYLNELNQAGELYLKTHPMVRDSPRIQIRDTVRVRRKVPLGFCHLQPCHDPDCVYCWRDADEPEVADPAIPYVDTKAAFLDLAAKHGWTTLDRSTRPATLRFPKRAKAQPLEEG